MKRQMIIPEGYLNLTSEQKKKICNGAGSSQYIDFVPDTMYGLNLNEAADIHDYMYYIGVSRLDKLIADVVYLHNMLVIIEDKSLFIMGILRKNRALEYAMAVNSFGDSSFFTIDKSNEQNHDELDLVDYIHYVGKRLDVIKRFTLISCKKIATFNNGLRFECSRINSCYIDIIKQIVAEIEDETKEKVISSYEKKFNSYFEKC